MRDVTMLLCACVAVVAVCSMRVPWKDALLQAAEAKARDQRVSNPHETEHAGDEDAAECVAEDGEEEAGENDEEVD